MNGDGFDLLLLQLFRKSVWSGPTVADEPHIQLVQWSVRLDQHGNRYFVGVRADDHTGRVSTAIVEFDLKSRRGRTKSGRIYDLVGPAGRSSDADYVWSLYQRINGLVESEVAPTAEPGAQ